MIFISYLNKINLFLNIELILNFWYKKFNRIQKVIS